MRTAFLSLLALLAHALGPVAPRMIATRRLHVDVEVGACVAGPAQARLRRDAEGYRVDVVTLADDEHAPPVWARLEEGTLRLWVGQVAPASGAREAPCLRHLVVRPRLVGEPVRAVLVEGRDGVIGRAHLSE